jgi:Tfp pilus assembly protein PilF
MSFGCTTVNDADSTPTRCRFGREGGAMYGPNYEAPDAYVAFQEGTRLLAGDNAHAAVIALERARALEPAQGSVREALARAYFRAGRFTAAEEEFQAAVDIDPVNDYAHYGIGVCRLRQGDVTRARGHLRIATVMRPDNVDYRRALDEASDEEPADDAGSDASGA